MDMLRWNTNLIVSNLNFHGKHSTIMGPFWFGDVLIKLEQW